jgi:catechol 2,3-dioxygenase-like lactoylglutathione lyase family enzyme
MKQRLATVSLVVPDYDEALEFYTGTLGFILCEDEPMEDGKRWVTVAPPGAGPGACRLLLAKARGPRQEAVIGCQTGGRVFLFLETDDFARDHAAMRAKGVRFLEAPRSEPYGTVAVFEDPFGNKWDLLEPRPLPRGGAVREAD